MALTQRLEFRQSQSLVMTPQLMQAIKLLQLSNLDLSAFVEEELERNPLLDRASDGPEAPVAGEPAAERAEYADSGSYGEDGGGEPSDMALRLRRRRLRARPGGVAEPRPRHPHRDRADAGHPARQRLFRGTRRSRRPRGAGCGSDRLHRMGRRRLQRRRLQSGSLRRRRGDARRPSRRAARGGVQRAGAAHDRAVSDRSRRRCRLSAAGSGTGRRAAGRLAGGCRCGADGAAEVRSARRLRAEFERVPRNPAPRTQPLRPRHAGAGGKSRSAGQARHRRRCANCAASTTKISPT